MSTMTQALSPARATRHDIPASRPRLVSGRFAAALLSSFGALTSFYLLLSVTPMYAMSAGAGSAGAGLVTGSLMLTTVLAEFASPRLLGRFGYRAVFAAGALLLGGPAPALLLPHSMATIIAVSIARGIGFGLATVVLGALVAASVPAERRGEGIGLAGVVACVPAIVALPSGVWLTQNTGYAVVIAITAISALAPLAAVPWLAAPDNTASDNTGPASQQAGAGQAGLARLTRLRQGCWAACAPAACCGPASSSRPRPYRPAWWPRSCRWRRACPRASPRSGCSRRP
ncbi:MAG: MFS transporter [Streptosporangiaceae bacterium]